MNKIIINNALILTILSTISVLLSGLASGSPNIQRINLLPLFFNRPFAVGGEVYFSGANDTYGTELWKSNGTPEGTGMIKDIFAGPQGGGGAIFAEFEGELYFSATSDWDVRGIWKTDGTLAGTVPLKAGLNAQSGVVVNGVLLLSAFDGVHGYELWKSDGTAAGTSMIKDIVVGAQGSSLSNLCNVGGILYFSVEDRRAASQGAQLWKSDGTEEGTVMVKNVNARYAQANMRNFSELEDTLYFVANDGINGSELWKSDGTLSGTKIVKDINPGDSSSAPSELILWEGYLYFSADDGINGRCWWKSDGTLQGTLKIKNIYAESPTLVGNCIFFVGVDPELARTLWKSDGTEEGTVLVKDIQPGSTQSNIFGLTAVGDVLYFSADDGIHGSELWRSDGTAQGTEMVADLVIGPAGSSPASLIAVSNKLFFSALSAESVRNEIYVLNAVGQGGEETQTIPFTAGAVYIKSLNIGDDGTTLALLGGSVGGGGLGEFGLNRSVVITSAGIDTSKYVGTAVELVGTEGDTFVLSMSYDVNAFIALFGGSATPILGWRDGTAWVTAINGNEGGASNFVRGPWMAEYALGTYGMDTATHTVWAVVNHNSLFAVIPGSGKLSLEPAYSTWLEGFLSPVQLDDPKFYAASKDPDHDGVSNLLEYAFNLSPVSPDVSLYDAEGGLSGLPRITRVESGGTYKLRIEYIRRTALSAPGITYIPQFSTDLTDRVDDWTPATGQEVTTLIDENWERVVIEDTDGGALRRFGRIKIVTQ